MHSAWVLAIICEAILVLPEYCPGSGYTIYPTKNKSPGSVTDGGNIMATNPMFHEWLSLILCHGSISSGQEYDP